MAYAAIISRMGSGLSAIALPLAVITWAPASAEAASFQRFYVFGDSLSDTGRTSALTGGLVPPPFLLTADLFNPVVPAYADGRFSNGPVWIDFLTEDFGITGGTNYAVTSATTGSLNTAPIPGLPGLTQQVGQFLAENIAVTSEDLFILFAGSNDYLGTANQTNPSIPVANLEGAIRAFAGAGAQNILVTNLPDLGLSPFVQQVLDPVAASTLVNQHNTLLANTLTALKAEADFQANLISFDIFSLINEAVANPAAFGLNNIQQACLLPSPLFFPPGPVTRCDNPDEFLFYDSLHPSSRVHRFVADSAAAVLRDSQPVATPEPMSILGLGILGGALWLSRRQSSVALDSGRSDS
jgi:phospholipase/lecithinase/hemolysin